MKTLQIEKTPSGQFRYRIIIPFEDLAKTCVVVVDWEFGPYSKEETIEQAKDRFLGNSPFNVESR
jgi:hypothetical protein